MKGILDKTRASNIFMSLPLLGYCPVTVSVKTVLRYHIIQVLKVEKVRMDINLTYPLLPRLHALVGCLTYLAGVSYICGNVQLGKEFLQVMGKPLDYSVF